MSDVKPPNLGDFLRMLRAQRGDPETSGGMTRQILAETLHTSAGYIAKLESGDVKSPSVSVLDAIAETFALSGAEIRHLYNLARQTPTEREIVVASSAESFQQRIDAQQRHAIENLEPHLACYLDERWNVIACNRPYDAVFPGLKESGNVLRWFFSCDQSRTVMVEWEEEARLTVGWFRALMGRYYDDDWAENLLSSLEFSDEFRRFWAAGEVSFGRATPYMRVRDVDTGEESVLHVNVFSHITSDSEQMQFYLGVRVPTAALSSVQ